MRRHLAPVVIRRLEAAARYRNAEDSANSQFSLFQGKESKGRTTSWVGRSGQNKMRCAALGGRPRFAVAQLASRLACLDHRLWRGLSSLERTCAKEAERQVQRSRSTQQISLAHWLQMWKMGSLERVGIKSRKDVQHALFNAISHHKDPASTSRSKRGWVETSQRERITRVASQIDGREKAPATIVSNQ